MLACNIGESKNKYDLKNHSDSYNKAAKLPYSLTKLEENDL